MRRGRGKAKKQSAVASREDLGNEEEEKVPAAHRRRGRPQKQPKDDNLEEEEEVEKREEENGEEGDKDGSKIKRSAETIEADTETQKEENGIGSKLSVGFRQNGRRRKNKPRRAAEAVVECR